MAIARFPGLVIDCPDAGALAGFYGALLGWNVKDEGDWAEIRPDDGSNCISFQQVDGYQAPEWPGQSLPQQMHLDLVVQDLDDGEKRPSSWGPPKRTRSPAQPSASSSTRPATPSASA